MESEHIAAALATLKEQNKTLIAQGEKQEEKISSIEKSMGKTLVTIEGLKWKVMGLAAAVSVIVHHGIETVKALVK